MRLGLIGTGKQGQRYLMEKNGGRHIVRSGSREIDYEGLDGVIIATHPAGHKKLALECIERGLPFLCEKPLALSLDDCMVIIDSAWRKGVPMQVAHSDLWAAPWLNTASPMAYCIVRYTKHSRDYSAWLDWAPHALAVLDKAGCCDARNVILENVAEHTQPLLQLFNENGRLIYERLPVVEGATPMALAVRDLCYAKNPDWDSLRRVYRALFSEEHGQGK